MADNRILIVLYLAIFIVPIVLSLSKESLYPHTGAGSQYLQTDSNGQLISIEVKLKTPIAFYDKSYNSIFVSIKKFIITNKLINIQVKELIA